MKKFAAIILSIMLVAAVAFGTVASAASVLDETTGTLTLTKYEQQDDAQTEGETPVSGAVFTAYKVASIGDDGLYTVVDAYKDVEVTYGGKIYTLQQLLNGDVYDEDGGALTYTSTELFEQLIPALQAVAANQTGIESTESEENPGTYTFGDLALGVYLVVETEVPDGYAVASQSFLVSIPEWVENEDGDGGEWNYDVTASPKDSPVEPDKSIVTDDGDADEDTVAIGDTVDYKVTSNLPYYGNALPTSWTEGNVFYPTEQDFNDKLDTITYKFTDTMSKGLTFNDDVEVVIGTGNDVVTLTKDTDYTVSTTTDDNGATVITIDFVWANINEYQGQAITVTYSAILNEDAVVGPNGNDNSVTITYDNNPQLEDSEVTTDEDKTTVYTYGMELTKTFNGAAAADSSIDASGVEFSLSQNDEKLWFITSELGVYYACSADMLGLDELTEGKKVTIDGVEYTVTQKLNPSSDGKLTVNGLDEGEYTLVEENSIEGYSKLTSDVTIVVEGVEVDGSYTGKVSATVGTKSLTVSDKNIGLFELSVNNVSKQFDLPLTGGTGILVFTIGGGIIIAAAIIIFSQLRKKKVTDQ